MSIEREYEEADLSLAYGARVQEENSVNFEKYAYKREASKEAQKNSSFIEPNSHMKFKSKNGKKSRSARTSEVQRVSAPRHPSECLNEHKVIARSSKLDAIIAERARRIK
tara:strand:+ start:2127 stop:2456 length:330 start_codon:yes stop_codon:yes gene_type:complete